jgi:hypothetical protein
MLSKVSVASLVSVGSQVSVASQGSVVQFSPASIADLQFWYRSDLGIVLDGSNNVSQWGDQSGNGRHLTQATAGFRPAYVASGGPGGLPYLDFDGTNDALFTSSFAIAQPITIYMVTKFDAAYAGEGDGHNRFADATLPITNQMRFMRRAATNTIGFSAPTFMTDAAYADALAWNYSRIIANGASSEIREAMTVRSSSNAGGTGFTGGLAVGAFADGTFAANASDTELFAYNKVVTAAEDALIVAYLRVRYALA